MTQVTERNSVDNKSCMPIDKTPAAIGICLPKTLSYKVQFSFAPWVKISYDILKCHKTVFFTSFELTFPRFRSSEMNTENVTSQMFKLCRLWSLCRKISFKSFWRKSNKNETKWKKFHQFSTATHLSTNHARYSRTWLDENWCFLHDMVVSKICTACNAATIISNSFHCTHKKHTFFFIFVRPSVHSFIDSFIHVSTWLLPKSRSPNISLRFTHFNIKNCLRIVVLLWQAFFRLLQRKTR